MTANVLGNHAKGYKGDGIRGTGNQLVPVQMGWAAVSGKAGEIAFVQLSGLVTGDINQGVFFQTEAAVNVRFTLANPGTVLDPDPIARGAALWTPVQAVAPGTIEQADFSAFTIMEMTFTAPGTCYVVVR